MTLGALLSSKMIRAASECCFGILVTRYNKGLSLTADGCSRAKSAGDRRPPADVGADVGVGVVHGAGDHHAVEAHRAKAIVSVATAHGALCGYISDVAVPGQQKKKRKKGNDFFSLAVVFCEVTAFDPDSSKSALFIVYQQILQ